jgi:hypothetical protein
MARVVHPARVIAFALDSQKVLAGGTVTARYAAIGESGTLRLVDAAGTIWSEVPLQRAGVAHLRAPDVSNDQAMRVMLIVNHAGTTATSNAGVIVVAQVPQVAAQSLSPMHDPEGMMAVSRNRFPGGSTITVRILRHEDHLRIALQHADGSEVSAVNVAPGDRSVTLVAPDVGGIEQYTILASYLRGIGEQLSVIPVTLYPH